MSDTEDDADEEFCYYCGEPLEDGLCSVSCLASADDEGRLEDIEDAAANTKED
jgi:hypothetical protein